ncbi:unnamed protein product [Rotaria sp. Silwood1]|nr:unnamed protein product [Rotaria sp. Silwood1]CAF5029600.1 unnamed protein product [Rotaria sp. Silwood1]
MASMESSYITIFSDARVFQVEFANKAVEISGTIVVLRCKDAVVFVDEKIITSRLYESGSNERLHNMLINT